MATILTKMCKMDRIPPKVYSVFGQVIEFILFLKSVSSIFSSKFEQYQILTRGWLNPPALRHPAVWIHAASIGEARLAIAFWEAARPHGLFPVLTVQTVSALTMLRSFRPELSVHLAPLDGPASVGRAFDCISPVALWIVETEIWPTMLLQAHARNVPVLFLNGRISARAFRGYQRFPSVFEPSLRPAWILARLSEDAERFVGLGARPERVQVLGDAKFLVAPVSRTLPAIPHLEQWLKAGPVLMAASTHANEEAVLLSAFRSLKRELPSLRLLLAPRHPERVARESWADGLWRRSQRHPLTPAQASEQVFVLDSLGELATFYPFGTVVWAGGTLAPVGGHNLFEAAAHGALILYGPHTQNVEHQVAMLEAKGQGQRIQDIEALVPALRAALTLMPPMLAPRVESPPGTEEAAMQRCIAERINGWLEDNHLRRPDDAS